MYEASRLERYGPTQRRLLEVLLHTPGGASVEHLTRELGITHNAVRTHLIALQRDGVIERLGQQRTGGRPEHLFVLTPAGRETFPRRYREIAESLIAAVERTLGHGALDKVMHGMGTEAGRRLVPPRSPKASVSQTAAAMKELGYEASLSVSDKRGEEIVARNCVFHELAAKYPAVCQFDLAFMEATVGRAVEHRECMLRGGQVCRFGFKSK